VRPRYARGGGRGKSGRTLDGGRTGGDHRHITVSARNVRLFLAFRVTTRALLFAPYIFHFMTGVRGLTASDYGLLQLVYYWGVTATEVPSGVIADRLGRRATLLCGALVNGLGCWAFALAHSFTVFAAAELMFALGTALISGADSALLYDSLAVDRREKDYARAEGAGQALWLGATAIGLPLTDWLLVRGDDPVLAYWVTGALSILGAGFALAMVEPPAAGRQTAREITLGAVRDVARRPRILRVVVYSVGVFVLLRAAVVGFFNPVLAACRVPVDRYGTVLAMTNVAGALTAWRLHRWLDRRGYRAAMWALPVSMLGMMALLIPLRTPAASALFMIQGAAFAAYPLVVRGLLNRMVRAAGRRATVLSLVSMACRVVFGLVIVFAGWSLDANGLSFSLLATALLGCVPLALLPLIRGRRRGAS